MKGGEVVFHNGKITYTVFYFISRHGLHGIKAYNGNVFRGGTFDHGICDSSVGAVNNADSRKGEFIDFAGQKQNGIESGFRFGGAALECGIIIQIVIIGHVPERKTVAEKKRIVRGSMYRFGVTIVQIGQFFLILIQVIDVDLSMVRIDRLNGIFDAVAKNACIA